MSRCRPTPIEPWVQQRIEQLLVVAPTRYPDGSPFPASSAMHDLGRALTQTANFLSDDATVAIIGLSRIMSLFAHIATTQPTSTLSRPSSRPDSGCGIAAWTTPQRRSNTLVTA
ncbi:MAG: hypothetical protein ACRDP9_29615 [Kribbellaceae bacterium]